MNRKRKRVGSECPWEDAHGSISGFSDWSPSSNVLGLKSLVLLVTDVATIFYRENGLESTQFNVMCVCTYVSM